VNSKDCPVSPLFSGDRAKIRRIRIKGKEWSGVE